MKNITLYIGKISKNWEGKLEWTRDLFSTGLTFESVEDAMKVIEIAKPEVWRIVRITEGILCNASKETIAEHPLITETLQRDKQEREEFIAKQHARVKEINSLPKTWTVFKKSFGNSEVSVIVERTEAFFNPEHSNAIQCFTSTFLEVNGKRKEIFLDLYISPKGKILRKRFIESSRFEPWEGLASMIAEHLPTIFEEVEKIKSLLKSITKK